MQVFKYVLQFLRARRDGRAFSLPDSQSSDIAAAVADEAVFLGLSELQTASLRFSRQYQYDFKHYSADDILRKNSSSGLVTPGWELVSVTPHTQGSKDGFYGSHLVICRRLKP